MGTVAAGLGRIGESFAAAKDLQQADAERKRKLAIEQIYAQLQQQTGVREESRLKDTESEQAFRRKIESQPKVVGTIKGADGKAYNIVQDPLTGKRTTEPVGVTEETPITQKVEAFKQLFGRDPNEDEKKQIIGVAPKEASLTQKWTEAQEIGKSVFPNDAKRAMEFARSLLPGGASVNKIVFPGVGPQGKTSGLTDKTLKALADKWQKEGIKPPAKYQTDVESYMEEHDMKAKTKLTALEEKSKNDIKVVEPLISQLQKYLEDNKLQEVGRGGMFSPSAVWERSKIEKAWKEYQNGLPPSDKNLGNLIRMAAALKIRGAAPLMSIGRGKYLYSEIVQHLPQPTDTPALLYDKVQFLRQLVEDAKLGVPDDQPDLLPGEEIER